MSHSRQHPSARNPSAHHSDILVFGYGCTLFRNDARAETVESLLQPWHDEANGVWMDRFDVRNLLDDLAICDQPACHIPDADSEDEMCDEERYRDVDSEEEALFDMSEDERVEYLEEKRRRRLEENNRGIHYDYGPGDGNIVDNMGEADTLKADQKVQLKYAVPAAMITPPDQRIADIIEKTATFINNSTNPQMEVLIQAKQANNPDFGFLHLQHSLHPYYEHVRSVQKSGLAGLTAYGSDSDSDDEEQQVHSPEDAPATPDLSMAPLTWTAFRGGGLPQAVMRQVQNTTLNIRYSPDRDISIPPPDPQAIIDKMASFVARNGPSFEAKVKEKNRGDPRFAFLLPWNEFHMYYKSKRDGLSVHDGQTTVSNDTEGGAPTSHASTHSQMPDPRKLKAERLARARAYLATMKAKSAQTGSSTGAHHHTEPQSMP
ncbi:hypothetical protein SpCBS45565_g01652 [Spizellomyces sp. 'palustris']|nr:hypothetical protein SpCBS45565_g01652 [Spizellomyces sp. 'palustris']